MRAGIEPCKAASEDFDAQIALFEIDAVEVGDLQLAACGRLQRARDVDDLIVVVIESRYSLARFGLLGLFFNRANVPSCVEACDAIALRIVDVVHKDGRTAAVRVGTAHDGGKVVAEKEIISQDQRHRIVADGIGTDDECLRDAFGSCLSREAQVEAPTRRICEQPLKQSEIMWR